MKNLLKSTLAGAALLAPGFAAQAADIYEPVYTPPPEIIYKETSFGGWYLRGDIDYHWSQWGGGDYITYGAGVTCCGNPYPIPGEGSFDDGELKGGFSIGGGVGYQITPYLRTDVTADYWFKSEFTGTTSGFQNGQAVTSIDRSEMSALLLMANAYADLGTYYGVTPYVGAGIGGAHIKWGTLSNEIPELGIYEEHEGAEGWRFAYSLMAGASYCLTDSLDLDIGYRFTRIAGGKMFEETSPSGASVGVGPGFDDDFNTHEVRAGLRYKFGGYDRDCGVEQVAYQEPVFKPVYK